MDYCLGLLHSKELRLWTFHVGTVWDHSASFTQPTGHCSVNKRLSSNDLGLCAAFGSKVWTVAHWLTGSTRNIEMSLMGGALGGLLVPNAVFWYSAVHKHMHARRHARRHAQKFGSCIWIWVKAVLFCSHSRRTTPIISVELQPTAS